MEWIYALVEQDTRAVRYVGRTKNLSARRMEHNRDRARTEWGSSLQARDTWFDMAVVMEADHPYVALAEFVVWNFFREQGCDLLNIYTFVSEFHRHELRKFREKHSLTQAQLAKELGKSLRQVQYYEAGIIDVPYHVERLLEFLDRGQRFEFDRRQQHLALTDPNNETWEGYRVTSAPTKVSCVQVIEGDVAGHVAEFRCKTAYRGWAWYFKWANGEWYTVKDPERRMPTTFRDAAYLEQ